MTLDEKRYCNALYVTLRNAYLLEQYFLQKKLSTIVGWELLKRLGFLITVSLTQNFGLGTKSYSNKSVTALNLTHYVYCFVVQGILKPQ